MNAAAREDARPTITPSPALTKATAPQVERISKFLRVVTTADIPNEYGIMSNDHKLIGTLVYFKPWREWVLCPQPNTVWSIDCLASVNAYMKELTGEETKP